MDDTNSLIEQRRAKLKALEARGIFPFKNKFTPAETCQQARDHYVEGREVSVAGRITAHRDMGKSMFIDVRDQSGRLQCYAQKNVLGEEQFLIFRHLDLGDFIGAKGTLFTTKTGEISIKLSSFTILAKALRPLPGKWHGLEDTEIRYRQRYLDLISNPEVKDVMLKRSAIIREIRDFFHGRGYVEVETPMMQPIPGGAAAQPFKTHHNALGCDFYLRIALELYHKRLLVGGIDRLFEIGKNFRNEGLSRRHNPEFTMLEAYCAYGDYASMMETVETLITTIAKKVLGTLVIEHGWNALARVIEGTLAQLNRLEDKTIVDLVKKRSGAEAENFNSNVKVWRENLVKCKNSQGKQSIQAAFEDADRWINDLMIGISLERASFQNSKEDALGKLSQELAELEKYFSSVKHQLELGKREAKIINLTPNWRRAKYRDLVREKAGADWFEVTPAERRRRAIEDLKLGGDIAATYEDFEVTGAVFEKLIETTLINPTFVTHLPKELVPLAKLTPDDPTTVEVFECCINGQEISPGYTEQNDPVAQRAALEHQAGGEQQKLDEDFLVALEHGMPPAGGIGIGIDRLCMMLLGQESIRDVILFPQLKPK
jgi:lysyl-tRNA synthetase class 2